MITLTILYLEVKQIKNASSLAFRKLQYSQRYFVAKDTLKKMRNKAIYSGPPPPPCFTVVYSVVIMQWPYTINVSKMLYSKGKIYIK